MGEVIVVTSGKGGSGKSLIAAGLAAQLAHLNKQVVAIDMDVGLRSLDILFQVENSVVYDIADVLDGTCPMKQALMRVKKHDGVQLINAPQFGDSSSITAGRIEEIMERLKRDFDFVIIDCPAGIGNGFRNAISAADRALVVLLPEPISVRDAEHAIGLLEFRGMDRIDLVFNCVRSAHMIASSSGGIALAQKVLNRNVIGAVPYDAAVTTASARGESIDLCAHAFGAALGRIARRVTGEDVPLSFPRVGMMMKIRAILHGETIREVRR